MKVVLSRTMPWVIFFGGLTVLSFVIGYQRLVNMILYCEHSSPCTVVLKSEYVSFFNPTTFQGCNLHILFGSRFAEFIEEMKTNIISDFLSPTLAS